MKGIALLLQCAFIALIVLSTAAPTAAADKSTGDTGPYQAGFQIWRGADSGFSGWTLAGVKLVRAGKPTAGSVMMFDRAAAQPGMDPAGGYYGGNFYNGGSFFVGEATSLEIKTDFAFQEAIASWDADTPDGTWIEMQARAQTGGRWTKWYNLGVWAATYTTIQRHSVKLQGDADGYVAVDTLVLAKSKLPADALQLKVRLFSADGVTSPTVRSISLAYSTTPVKKMGTSAGDPANWGKTLDVPLCSQMVYPDGGNVWCSPTSTSMVLGYWGIDPGPCEPRVRAAVTGVYDWIYDGHGNWPFNTAYAASRGLEAYVERFTSMDALEPWIAAGVPVVMSIAWNKNDLDGAPVSSSSGHLIVLVGFDEAGNPVVNDPAAAKDSEVRRTYNRQQLETVWLSNSGGTVYLIYPAGRGMP